MPFSEKNLTQLRDWKAIPSDETTLKRIADLPTELATIAYLFLGRGADGKVVSKFWSDKRNKPEKSKPPTPLAELLVAFDNINFGLWGSSHRDVPNLFLESVSKIGSLENAQRLQIFSVLYGEMAPLINVVWNGPFLPPYSTGMFGNPFRTSEHPMIGRSKAFFLEQMYDLRQTFPSVELSPSWMAMWLPYISNEVENVSEAIIYFLCSLITQQQESCDEILQILAASAENEHEVGFMGDHVLQILMQADNKEGWNIIGDMLLNAERQEGVREAITTILRLSHPEAMRFFLKLIHEEKLLRYPSVQSELNRLFGFNWQGKRNKELKTLLDHAVKMLCQPAEQDIALTSDDPNAILMALWCSSVEDAANTIIQAERFANHPSDEVRMNVVGHLIQLRLTQSTSLITRFLHDNNLIIAIMAAGEISDKLDHNSDYRFNFYDESEHHNKGKGAWSTIREKVEESVLLGLASVLERLAEDKEKGKPGHNSDDDYYYDEELAIINILIKSQKTELIDAVVRIKGDILDWHYEELIHNLVDFAADTPSVRNLLLDRAGSKTKTLFETPIDQMQKLTLTEPELQVLEGYLTRSGVEYRSQLLQLFFNLKPNQLLSSTKRLLACKNARQKQAGLEFLKRLISKEETQKQARELFEEWETKTNRRSKDVQVLVDEIHTVLGKTTDSDSESKVTDNENPPAEERTYKNAFGLIDLNNRSKVIPPQDRGVPHHSKSVNILLQSLDDWIHQHKELEHTHFSRGEEVTEPLGNINYLGYARDFHPKNDSIKEFPFYGIWKEWLETRSEETKDPDGLEFYRATLGLAIVSEKRNPYSGTSTAWIEQGGDKEKFHRFLLQDAPEIKLKYPELISHLLGHFYEWNKPEEIESRLFDIKETIFANFPQSILEMSVDQTATHKMHWSQYLAGLPTTIIAMVNPTRGRSLSCRSPELQIRHWNFLRWCDEPFPGAPRKYPGFEETLVGYQHGVANLNDIGENIINATEKWFLGIAHATQQPWHREHKLQQIIDKSPEIQELINSGVDRILEIELNRGTKATEVTDVIFRLNSVFGMEKLPLFYKAMGKNKLLMDYSFSSGDAIKPKHTFSHLIKVCLPANNETQEDFNKIIEQAIVDNILTEEKLLQLAFYSPQWMKFIAGYLGWNGFEEAYYWLLEHSLDYEEPSEALFMRSSRKDFHTDDNEDTDCRQAPLSLWERLILERTSLDNADRQNGAIDVDWFWRVYNDIEKDHWDQLAEALKYASSAQLAKKSRLVADVLRGQTDRQELVDGIEKKALKTNVRLLGLLPLRTGEEQQDIQERYDILRGYQTYAKQRSSFSRTEALEAFEAGMKNLASTAGYRDPMRLEWAMEAEHTKDLADGAITVTKDDISVTLEIDQNSIPQILIQLGTRKLKNLPKSHKNEPEIVELVARSKALKKTASRVRESLEKAMCRGDLFTGKEIQELLQHAVVAPVISRLVFWSEKGIGYPINNEKALLDYEGNIVTFNNSDQFRIAHPVDFYENNNWDQWQKECFQFERIQPFKQVFRELYLVTEQEKQDKTVSHRYTGHKVKTRQAKSLFSQREWHCNDYYEEDAWKPYPEHRLSVDIEFDYREAEVGLESFKIESIKFKRSGSEESINNADIPPRIFSEIMRDIDLVVSVAHTDDYDPEVSISTVEFRTQLVQETCQLLGLSNVEIRNTQALITGEMANYSIHLGSGVVHLQPGGAICVVPVKSGYADKLFLPFTDNDPRTAEVISKVLLFARDKKIKDPIILEQIVKQTK